ncbi:hypothetical protein J2S13_002688 [Oikeobacillus pervagus]|uniref:Uncharacterized protein n=1 Tax=Oikeobacillus pervagus TaxID=1325931 RepID=A0AAJ1T3U8_9BACI|nr:hypothetical protein [Oikeobacillus pervagus]
MECKHPILTTMIFTVHDQFRMKRRTTTAGIMGSQLLIRDGFDHLIDHTGDMMFWDEPFHIQNGKASAIIVGFKLGDSMDFGYKGFLYYV